LKVFAAVITCIIFISMPLKPGRDTVYPELQEYREELKDYISILKTEIADKETELEGLDEELSKLEEEHSRLLAESIRIKERIDSLTQTEHE